MLKGHQVQIGKDSRERVKIFAKDKLGINLLEEQRTLEINKKMITVLIEKKMGKEYKFTEI